MVHARIARAFVASHSGGVAFTPGHLGSQMPKMRRAEAARVKCRRLDHQVVLRQRGGAPSSAPHEAAAVAAVSPPPTWYTRSSLPPPPKRRSECTLLSWLPPPPAWPMAAAWRASCAPYGLVGSRSRAKKPRLALASMFQQTK